MKNQKGFTLTELLAVLALVVIVALIGFGGYIAWHFISKFW